MKILVTGIDGQLGNQLEKFFQKSHEIIGLKRNQFNLQNNELRNLKELRDNLDR